MKKAVELYRAGRVLEAETHCLRILNEHPNHSAALHLLGTIAGAQGHFHQAIQLIERSIQISPNFLAGYITLGQIYVSNGNLPAALRAYKCAARLRPDDPYMWYLLGVVQRMNCDAEAAIASFQQATHLHPDYPEALAELGALLRTKARFAEALKSFEAAARTQPTSAQMLSNYGATLSDLGRYEEAKAVYEQAIRVSGDAPVYLVNYADLLAKMSDYTGAIETYLRAINLDSGFARAHMGLGGALARIGRYDESVFRHLRALELAPNDSDAHATYGWVLSQIGKTKEAEEHCRRAVQLNPDSAISWQILGSMLSGIGRFSEAEKCFLRSAELFPNASIYLLISSTQPRSTERELQRLRSILVQPQQPQSDRAYAYFALGKMLDDMDRFDEAFQHFQKGNELVKDLLRTKGGASNRSSLQRQVEEIITTFTPAFFQANRSLGYEGDLPVFIVGMPRSGTTLVEQIAASHSKVFGAGELSDVGAAYEGFRSELALRDESEIGLRGASAAAKSYLEKLKALGGAASRVIDKMPGNIFNLGLIATFFPQARIVFCQRDPRDTCLSCYFQRFSMDNLAFSYDLLDCAYQNLAHDRLLAHWKTNLPLKMHIVRYEDMVSDLERESRRLISFLGLEWEPRCLEFYKTQRAVLTASLWQVRQPIYSSSVGRWKHYRKHLGPLFDALGISPDAE